MLSGCRQTGEKKAAPAPPAQQHNAPEQDVPERMPAISMDGAAVGKIGSFEQLTPEIFVELTILYRKEMKEWLKTARTLKPSMRERYLEKANQTFFSAFGITEEEYVRFGENNTDELNRYLEEHPELLIDAMG
jgi:hypothetical protein